MICYGGKPIITKSEHTNGTERIAEAAESLDADLLVNIQGDEPLVDPNHIERVIAEHANILNGTSLCLPCLLRVPKIRI